VCGVFGALKSLEMTLGTRQTVPEKALLYGEVQPLISYDSDAPIQLRNLLRELGARIISGYIHILDPLRLVY
jgi:hypothetical protein